MANFAVIINDKVVNIIVADSKTIAEEATNALCVEYTADNPAYIGLGYDGLLFEQPESLSIEDEVLENEIIID